VGENGLYIGNVEIIAVSEIHKVCMSYCFVSEDQIPDPQLSYLVKF
jgi:hypothetical protein